MYFLIVKIIFLIVVVFYEIKHLFEQKELQPRKERSGSNLHGTPKERSPLTENLPAHGSHFNAFHVNEVPKLCSSDLFKSCSSDWSV